MKKILMVMMAFGLVFSASAQFRGGGKGGSRGSVRVVVPRVTVIGGYAPYLGYGYGYGLGYNPYFGYNPFYGPGMNPSSRSTKLDLQVADIKNDYSDRIWSARHDKNLSRSERRAKVHELKHERNSAVIEAKRNYHNTRSDYKS